MKRRHKRLLIIVVSFCAVGLVLLFILSELRRNISFFYTTSELLSGPHRNPNAPVRVGGMVIKGSVVRDASGVVSFDLTDLNTELKVIYSGVLPPLFGEGVGAVAKGRLLDGKFVADEVLAKHDEKYMPKKYK
ncbi:cytochrome c maturation protein CcmE [Anaplasma capra]|uniref:cytochrome c maturation protein CcmE n=1 Tax=Anaplasma capra TaxID=1562740 RepID=UPI0021D58884|nr:cytochrome c maturation protein CcmE [Anaplasma capra]MCU7611452.1 cytochrome c maturation protein CcmE [Anaplasma capra]MCU7612109.1 cytochrome c maturation protein CcmE [Anaplasma capra]